MQVLMNSSYLIGTNAKEERFFGDLYNYFKMLIVRQNATFWLTVPLCLVQPYAYMGLVPCLPAINVKISHPRCFCLP